MSSQDDQSATQEGRLAEVLLSLTRDLLERSISPAFYDTILDHALELVPGAQAGSLLIRDPDGNYRFAATKGFDLDRLISVVFSEQEITADLGAGDHALVIRDIDRRNEALLTDDLREQLREVGETTRIRSTLAVPIVLDAQIAASFRLDNFDDEDAFDDTSIRLAEALGQHIGTVVRRLRLQERAEAAVKSQTLRADVERLLLASADIAEFFPALTRRLAADLKVDGCAVFHLRRGQERVEAFDARGRRLEHLERAFEACSLFVTGAATDERAEAGLGSRLEAEGWVSISDTNDAPRLAGVSEAARAVEFARLRLGPTTWGALAFFSAAPNAFTARDRTLLGTLTEGIELELQHQAHRERLRSQVDQLNRLVATTDTLSLAESTGEVVEHVLEAAIEAVAADTATVLFLDATRETLRVAGSLRRGGGVAAEVGALVPRPAHAWRVLDEGALLWRRRDDGASSAAFGAGPAEALLGIPVRSRRGEPVGVLMAALCGPGSAFDPERVGFFEAVAQAAGAALVRLELLEESRSQARAHRSLYVAAQAQAEELALLDELRSAVARELDVAEVIRAAVEGTARLVGKSMVSVYLVERDELVLQHGVGYESLPARLPLERGIMGRVARTGRAELVRDTDADPDFVASAAKVKSEVAVPLSAEGRSLGVLNAESLAADFGESDMRLLVAIGEQLSVAVQRARLHAAVLDSEHRFRLLAEHMRDLVCLHDPDARFTYVSPSSETLLGYAPDELIGRSLLDLTDGEDHDALSSAFAALVDGGHAVEPMTYKALTRDGRSIWLETIAQRVTDERGDVVGIVTSSRDATERKVFETRLVHGALYDELTGLPNRGLLMDRLAQLLERQRRDPSQGFAVLFIDLDRFKVVNDSLGHAVGDALLRAIGERLGTAVRKVDTVARLGGDEFCVLLHDLREDGDAVRAAERVHEALRLPFQVEGRALFTTASIGIASSSDDYRTPDEVLRDADIAMYRAKHDGRSRHAVFDVGMHARAVSRLELETELRHALEHGGLAVAYQPIVELRGGRLIGVEALVRWHHAQRGTIPPGEFVPIAEESGLIAAVDRFVMRSACAQVAEWRRTGRADLAVSVNVSAAHVSLGDLASTVEEALEESGLPPEALKLEITESALMESAAVAIDVLQSMRERGTVVQIDDFGTGYSSLGYLQRLPIDSLKIDRSFVEGVAESESAQEIVTAIVHLARNLGIDVVAEGIETREQLAFLTRLGCEAGQGFLFAPPLTAAALEAEGWIVPVAT